MWGLRALGRLLPGPSVASSRPGAPRTGAAASGRAAGPAGLRGPSLLAVGPAAVRCVRAVQGRVHLLWAHRVSNVCLPEPLLGGEEPDGGAQAARAQGLSRRSLQPGGSLALLGDPGVGGCFPLDRPSVLDAAAAGSARSLAAPCGRRRREGPLVQAAHKPLQSPFARIPALEAPGDVVCKLGLGAQGALVARLQRGAQYLALALLQPLQVAGLGLSGRLVLKADVGRGGAPLRPLPIAGLPAGGVTRASVLELVSAGKGRPPVQGWASPAISDGETGGERSQAEGGEGSTPGDASQ